MKSLDNLVEKLRQELIELALKKGNLSDNELVHKSQELDKLLNSFYTSTHRRKQDCTVHTHKTIEKTVADPCKLGHNTKGGTLIPSAKDPG